MRMNRSLKLALNGISVLGVVAASLVAMSVPATAEECIDSTTGELTYCDTTPGTSPSDGNDDDSSSGGGSTKPPCKYQGEYNEFCEGTAACWGNNPAANSEESVADKLGPKPDDDEAHVAYKKCIRPDGSTYDQWYWATPSDGPTLAELAQRAYGALRIPAYQPTFNPPGATYVNLDTWWWAQGVSADPIIGSSALGLRAVATPSYMQVDPGDGSGTKQCDFSTEKSDVCVHQYRKSSDRMPGKAYPARMRLQYAVAFERNGTPLTIDGAPTALASPWMPVDVPVREVQTVVRPKG